MPAELDAMAEHAETSRSESDEATRPGQPAAPPRPDGPSSLGPPPVQAPSGTFPSTEEDHSSGFLHQLLRDSPGWLTSLVIHMALLLTLALWIIPGEITVIYEIIIAPVDQDSKEELEEIEPEDLHDLNVNLSELATAEPQPITDNIQSEANLANAADPDQATMRITLSPVGIETAPRSDLMQEIGSTAGTGFKGRGIASRKAMVATHGGNEASERSVGMALKWIAYHQLPDGGWSFDHTMGPGRRLSPNPGSMSSARMGATAMALLPFLGAGQTHKEGEYKKTVNAGLYFLVRNMKMGRKGGDLRDSQGRMYSHGLASIVLCEAYAMTQDKGLAGPAQASLNFIVSAQDRVGGGWRYTPGQRGDTSAVGWQIMALKSGHLAYLDVPPSTIRGAVIFLDSVQTDSGAAYGYVGPGAGEATTAVGLLSRMYLGWRREHPALERGVQKIGARGPSRRNLYRDYYAAQVMFQFTSAKGPMWDKWNTTLRDHLVSTQSQEGPTQGSWFVQGGGHGAGAGGRLYCTSMSTLMLEVYYRHMPVFKEAAMEMEFPD